MSFLVRLLASLDSRVETLRIPSHTRDYARVSYTTVGSLETMLTDRRTRMAERTSFAFVAELVSDVRISQRAGGAVAVSVSPINQNLVGTETLGARA